MWNEDKMFVEEIWPDATGDKMDPDVYLMLMQAAHEVCRAFAPVLPEGATVPESYKLAEIFQARHLHTQFHGGNRDEIGADGYAIPTYPLIFAARDLLRPKTSPLSRLR